METKNIRQYATFKASPHDVYETLMDSKKHGKLTGSKASVSRKVGGKFSIYEGEIEGKNLKLVPDKKIVQSWRYSDWPAGHFSKATFALEAVVGGTRLAFTQIGVPAELRDDVAQGWRDYYWSPMKEMFNG
jgi:activator of HSP90 ATPase